MPDTHERFRKMVESAQDWFWEFDENANFTYVSPSVKELLGYEPDELIGLNAFDLMSPTEAERVHHHFDPVAKKYLPFSNLKNSNIHKDGHEVVIESSGTPIFDGDGQFLGYRGIDRDITQRSKEKEELRQSEEKLQNILNNSSEWIWEIDLSGQHTYSNLRLLKMLGYHPEEFMGKDYLSYLHQDDLLEVQETLPRLISEQRGWNDWVLRWRHKDGSYRYLESNAKPIFDATGEMTGYLGADRDITERRKAEEDFKKSETLFRDFFESNPVGTIITSPSGTIHMINPAFSKASGFSVEEVVGHTSQELGFWRDPADREHLIAAIMEHGFIDNLETTFYRKNGIPLTGLVCSRAIKYEGDLRILSTVVDVTAQREAEKTLRKLDQAKSDFIATAAHELRTPLVAILGYAELLENVEQLPISAEDQRSYSSIIRSNAEILTRLTNDLLDVEQIQLDGPFRLTREETSLAKLIKKTIASVTLKHSDHRFVLTHANILPESMWIDSIRITQAINNLLDNAVKYSPQGRLVEIATETDETQVSISIRDHGIGMTSEEVEQIFHKFYRGKPMAAATQGLGLGMCIAKRVVEDHGGQICITSKPGEGTTVKFTLPIMKPSDMESRQ